MSHDEDDDDNKYDNYDDDNDDNDDEGGSVTGCQPSSSSWSSE